MQNVGARGSGRLSAMGEAGRMRVNKYFSFNAFASHLHDYVTIATGPDCSSELACQPNWALSFPKQDWAVSFLSKGQGSNKPQT